MWMQVNIYICLVPKNSRPNHAFFFSRQRTSKVDDIKIIRKVSLRFPSTRLSSFYCCPLSIFFSFTWLGEIWVIWRKLLIVTAFINPVIHTWKITYLNCGELRMWHTRSTDGKVVYNGFAVFYCLYFLWHVTKVFIQRNSKENGQLPF